MVTQIIYNGAVIGTVEPGETKLIKCNDKKMTGDLEIRAGERTEIKYGGTIIAIVDAGDSKVIKCAGKTMKSNIEIRVEDGKSGTDGFSPTVELIDISGGTRLVITDINGEKSADIMDGKDGKDGTIGKNGSDGVGIKSVVQTTTSSADGGSNVITVTKTDNTTSTFTVKNGSKGSAGKDGTDGKDGTSVTVAKVTESTASGGTNTVEFSDGKKINIKNGTNGANGTNGKDGTDGKTPVKGVDYYTEADKDELKSELSQIEAPKIVSSIAEMTDTSKHYVLDGYIYSNRTVVTPGSKIYPNKFVPSTVTLSSRLSGSSASVTASDGAKGSFVTDFIAVKDMGSVSPYYTRLNWEMPEHNDNKVVFYNSSKTRIGNNTFATTSTGEAYYTVSNGETVFDLKNMYPASTAAPSNWADVAYVRFQLFVKPSGTALVAADYTNCKITFDAIYEETEGTTKQEWVNTGIPYVPTFKTDLIGVLGEGNVIYLSENLPSGTYTLKYGDETYDTIGTITVE